ncbi:hypothetical protein H0H93_002929, partial [Arthromyces matolae]
MATFLGTGVFNSDGDMWKYGKIYLDISSFLTGCTENRFHRSMTRPFFTKERISHFEIFDLHSEDALNQAQQRLKEGYPVDFQ